MAERIEVTTVSVTIAGLTSDDRALLAAEIMAYARKHAARRGLRVDVCRESDLVDEGSTAFVARVDGDPA